MSQCILDGVDALRRGQEMTDLPPPPTEAAAGAAAVPADSCRGRLWRTMGAACRPERRRRCRRWRGGSERNERNWHCCCHCILPRSRRSGCGPSDNGGGLCAGAVSTSGVWDIYCAVANSQAAERWRGVVGGLGTTESAGVWLGSVCGSGLGTLPSSGFAFEPAVPCKRDRHRSGLVRDWRFCLWEY
jgi:hypothetical protein